MSDADDRYRKKLLTAWEDTFKKGQLTFWVFLALREQPRHVGAIRDFLNEATRGAITAEEQSLYRSLRKFRDLEMVDFDTVEGNRGPERKVYRLTPLGDDLLDRFIQRNIALYYDAHVKELIDRSLTS